MDVSEFQVNTLQTVLSSECGIHKTQGFIKKTRRFADSDIFVSKIAEGLILALKGKDMAAPKSPTYPTSTASRQPTASTSFY